MPLPFDWTRTGKERFLVGAPNRDAVHHLERTDQWPVHTSILVGPAKSGRSRLARHFAEATGATVYDPAQSVAEQTLFHAWNRAEQEQQPMLLVADAPPQHWAIGLPDLRSRLLAAPVVTILPPDADFAETLLAQMFAERGLAIMPDVPGYIATRVERSYVTLDAAVHVIDALAMATKRAPTLRLVRDALHAAGLVEDGEDSNDQSGADAA